MQANVTVSGAGSALRFPERDSSRVPNLPSTALCISGGGTRSMSAAMGQLRLLNHWFGGMDWTKHIGYVSSVSGGTWAASIWCHYTEGPSSDEELLGPIASAQELRNITLEEYPARLKPHQLAHPATKDLAKRIEELLMDNGSRTGHYVWIDAIGEMILQPFGLYKRGGAKTLFTYDPATAEAIKSRQDQDEIVAKSEFVVSNIPGKRNRPYLVMNTTVLWPENRREQMLSFQVTPLYAGMPVRSTLKTASGCFGTSEHITLGGGYVEPFALGTSRMDAARANTAMRTLSPPTDTTRYALSDAVGTSSAAPAAAFAEYRAIFGDLVPLRPILDYPSRAATTATDPQAFGDGGSLDNFGLLPMLQRQVDRILVLVNTNVPLSLDWNPSSSTAPPHGVADEDVLSLFGMKLKFPGESKPRLAKPNNQMFSRRDGVALITQLQACKRAGKPAIVTQQLRVTSGRGTKWWGIPSKKNGRAYTPTIMWVYLDVASSYADAVHPSVADALRQAWSKESAGPLKHFPNYSTIDEDGEIDMPWQHRHARHFFTLIQLTAVQVAALADYSTWCLQSAEAEIKKLFAV